MGKTIALTATGGHLWSIEEDGTLYMTDKNGGYIQVGEKGQYRGTEMLIGLDGHLYTVEQGTLYRTR